MEEDNLLISPLVLLELQYIFEVRDFLENKIFAWDTGTVGAGPCACPV